jgi:hypothetical protein
VCALRTISLDLHNVKGFVFLFLLGDYAAHNARHVRGIAQDRSTVGFFAKGEVSRVSLQVCSSGEDYEVRYVENARLQRDSEQIVRLCRIIVMNVI